MFLSDASFLPIIYLNRFLIRSISSALTLSYPSGIFSIIFGRSSLWHILYSTMLSRLLHFIKIHILSPGVLKLNSYFATWLVFKIMVSHIFLDFKFSIISDHAASSLSLKYFRNRLLSIARLPELNMILENLYSGCPADILSS